MSSTTGLHGSPNKSRMRSTVGGNVDSTMIEKEKRQIEKMRMK